MAKKLMGSSGERRLRAAKGLDEEAEGATGCSVEGPAIAEDDDEAKGPAAARTEEEEAATAATAAEDDEEEAEGPVAAAAAETGADGGATSRIGEDGGESERGCDNIILMVLRNCVVERMGSPSTVLETKNEPTAGRRCAGDEER